MLQIGQHSTAILRTSNYTDKPKLVSLRNSFTELIANIVTISSRRAHVPIHIRNDVIGFKCQRI